MTAQVPLDRDDRRRVLAATADFLHRAAEVLGQVPPMPGVRFDLRGRAAGEYRYPGRGGGPSGLIRYNPWVFALDLERHLADTVPHEVAHHLVALEAPRARPHGPRWQRWMRHFGVTPRARGDYPLDGVPVRRQRRFPYRCRCPGEVHAVSTTRHRRMLRGVRYLCLRCKAPLVPCTEGGQRPADRACTD